jgi:hypothetical protein
MVTIQQIDAAGLHVMAWLEDGVIKIKTLALHQLQEEHDAHRALTHPADPLNHDWPLPHLFDLARAKCAALKVAILNAMK